MSPFGVSVTEEIISPPVVVNVQKLLPLSRVMSLVKVPSLETAVMVAGPPVALGPPTCGLKTNILCVAIAGFPADSPRCGRAPRQTNEKLLKKD